MPLFVYTARNREGKVQKDRIEGPSREVVLNTLMQKGLLVTSLEEVKIKEKVQEALVLQIKKSFGRKKKRMHGRITTYDMVMFSRQLATMLDAGVTLLRSLTILISQTDSKHLLKILKDIQKEVEGGKTLRNAMAAHPKIFSNFWLGLIESGEASGHLSRALLQISRYLQNIEKIRQKLTSAMIYPSILICVAILAVFIFLRWVIPIFSNILTSFNIELPRLTQIVIKMSRLTVHYAIPAIIFMIGLGFLLIRLAKTERGKLILDQVFLKVPLVGDLIELVACERFASSLSTLLESGVSILHALDIVEKTMGNIVYQVAIQHVKEGVREGRSLGLPLEKSGVFPSAVSQMIIVGEEVGEVGKMLQQISDFYNEKIDSVITSFAALIEPLILIVVGGIVATLVISMFLPLFKLTQIR